MNIQHIETLMYNPFFLSKIIQSFLTGYKKEADLKTIFYVLPIIMYKDSRDRLNTARIDSTLYSIFLREVEFTDYNSKLNSKFTLSQVAELFEEYIDTTKKCLLILGSQKSIQIKEKIVLLEQFDYKKTPPSIREYFKSSHYLGVIFGNIEILELENFLEIHIEA
ncbi:three component ABC system middle component [Gorillibacterium sp. CAU 1737]|uniref:three component ABC system middle component n=1 Tax=Gorillibacterium sp. CAU 1737 TaxID=3140362 RepID=UPI003260DD6F